MHAVHCAHPMNTAATRESAESLSFGELLRTLHSWRLRILLTGCVCAALVYALASSLPPRYEAHVVAAPVSPTNSFGDSGGSMNRLGSLASLAGMSLGQDDHTAQSVAVLESQTLTTRYIEDNKLLPTLFPGKSGVTPWQGNKLFQDKVRSVKLDTRTNLVTITINWRDPALAASWANGLIKAANEHLRAEAIRVSESHIAYLTAEALKAREVEARQAIYARWNRRSTSRCSRVAVTSMRSGCSIPPSHRKGRHPCPRGPGRC